MTGSLAPRVVVVGGGNSAADLAERLRAIKKAADEGRAPAPAAPETSAAVPEEQHDREAVELVVGRLRHDAVHEPDSVASTMASARRTIFSSLAIRIPSKQASRMALRVTPWEV